MKYFLLLLFFSFSSILIAQGQTYNSRAQNTEGYISMGLQANALNYFGDLYSDISFTRPGVGFYLVRKLSPHWHTKLNFMWGYVQADDAKAPINTDLYARNLNFRNSIKELTLQLIYELRASKKRYQDRQKWTPYLWAGLGLIHHNPQAKFQNQWIDLQPLGTEGQGRPNYADFYSKIQIAMPIGIGIRFKINERTDITLETGLRILFFDYLDDVGGKFVNQGDLGNNLSKQLSNRTLEDTQADGSARQLTDLASRYGVSSYLGSDNRVYRTLAGFEPNQARGGSRNDLYLVTGFSISYIIDTGLKCPQFYKTKRTVY
ncbi:MAG: hypothetical protein EAZ55_11215 [Cytophagales bacterium]|nr:MAG: hypothetical protein EAZ55_11215 [Cytophagales bacterium]